MQCTTCPPVHDGCLSVGLMQEWKWRAGHSHFWATTLVQGKGSLNREWLHAFSDPCEDGERTTQKHARERCPEHTGLEIVPDSSSHKEDLMICRPSVKILGEILPQWWGKTNSRQHAALVSPDKKARPKRIRRSPGNLTASKSKAQVSFF